MLLSTRRLSSTSDEIQLCEKTRRSNFYWTTHMLCIKVFFILQPSSIHGRTSAFLLAVQGLCGVIEGRLSHFLPRWLRTGWQSVIARGNSLEILRRGWESNPGHREDRPWAIPLSYRAWPRSSKKWDQGYNVWPCFSVHQLFKLTVRPAATFRRLEPKDSDAWITRTAGDHQKQFVL